MSRPYKLVYFIHPPFLAIGDGSRVTTGTAGPIIVGSMRFNTEQAAKTIGRWLEDQGDTKTFLVYDPPILQQASRS